MLCAEVESTNPLTVESIILGLGAYFFPTNSLSKKNREMRRDMRKSCGLRVRCYADHLIDLNKYLASFPGSKLTDKIGMT